MKLRSIFITLACCLACLSLGQSQIASPNPTQKVETSQKINPPQKIDTVQMVRDVASLIAKHFPNKAQLQASADQLAKIYQAELKIIPGQVKKIVAEADTRLKGIEWQEKLNLALELWRVRSSLDLMVLLSPDVLSQLTGLTTRQVQHLITSFDLAEERIGSLAQL
jgi:hypothetical protein